VRRVLEPEVASHIRPCARACRPSSSYPSWFQPPVAARVIVWSRAKSMARPKLCAASSQRALVTMGADPGAALLVQRLLLPGAAEPADRPVVEPQRLAGREHLHHPAHQAGMQQPDIHSVQQLNDTVISSVRGVVLGNATGEWRYAAHATRSARTWQRARLPAA